MTSAVGATDMVILRLVQGYEPALRQEVIGAHIVFTLAFNMASVPKYGVNTKSAGSRKNYLGVIAACPGGVSVIGAPSTIDPASARAAGPHTQSSSLTNRPK